MKFCRDCKHCAIDPEYGASDPVCKSPKNGKINPVTGGTIPQYIFCETHRNNAGWLMARAIGACGKGARWFESKDQA